MRIDETGLAIISGILLANSASLLMEDCSLKEGIRNAVYSRAEKITPEVIGQAIQLANKTIGYRRDYIAGVEVSVAAWCLAEIYSRRKRKE